MSSDKQCAKHCRRKSKGFEARLILFKKTEWFYDKTAPKVTDQCLYWWENFYIFLKKSDEN